MPLDLDRQGWLTGVSRCPSPNCDDRPDGADIDLAVIHGISLPPGEFGGPYIDDLFLNRLDPGAHPYFVAIHTLKVSAHCLIRRDGDIEQFVSLRKRAWHAGNSVYAGRANCNDFSIGIELEGTDDVPYADAQYSRLAMLLAVIRRHYPAITADKVVGHCDVAPGRKTDPGVVFDWDRLRASLGSGHSA